MAKELTPREMFERAGGALTPAEDWRSALAAALDIRGDSVRQLLSGRMPLKTGHFRDLLSAIVAQKEELTEVETELRAWLAKQEEQE